MRFVKFRGKSRISNEWIYGDLAKMWNGMEIESIESTEYDVEIIKQ